MSARAIIAAAVLPLAAALLAAADEPAKDVKKEMDLLQGEWTMVSIERNGKKQSDGEVKATLTIKGEEWLVTASSKATFQIDPTKSPKTMDITFNAEGGGRGVVARGIYKLEDDVLTLCRTQLGGTRERPQEFKATEQGAVLVVWKRVKK
jgi:uncharacterized protein (TIGR03067 family)